MNINLDTWHYAMLTGVVAAAFIFAYLGKVDVSVAFGIAGTATGLALPVGTSPKA